MPNLERFIKAQNADYPYALAEIKNGRKQSHWMWYIFPQLAHEFRGQSENNKFYAIRGLAEAKEYWANELLQSRLLEITAALLQSGQSDPEAIMGSSIDAKKLRSCMTLFSVAVPEESIFNDVLEQFYRGRKCDWTMRLLFPDE